MPHGDNRTWIQTFTGRAFWPLDPRPEDVCIEDIAHALALKCRYTGHCRQFYSVAQHSVLVSKNCDHPQWGLMHDAAEAYIADVARPVKRSIPLLRDVEDRLDAVISLRFGLELPVPISVHVADLRLLATERRDLMSDPPMPWKSTEDVVPLPYLISGWYWEIAEKEFLSRFRELWNERSDAN